MRPDASDVPLRSAALLRNAGEVLIDLQQRRRNAEQQHVVERYRVSTAA